MNQNFPILFHKEWYFFIITFNNETRLAESEIKRQVFNELFFWAQGWPNLKFYIPNFRSLSEALNKKKFGASKVYSLLMVKLDDFLKINQSFIDYYNFPAIERPWGKCNSVISRWHTVKNFTWWFTECFFFPLALYQWCAIILFCARFHNFTFYSICHVPKI